MRTAVPPPFCFRRHPSPVPSARARRLRSVSGVDYALLAAATSKFTRAGGTGSCGASSVSAPDPRTTTAYTSRSALDPHYEVRVSRGVAMAHARRFVSSGVQRSSGDRHRGGQAGGCPVRARHRPRSKACSASQGMLRELETRVFLAHSHATCARGPHVTVIRLPPLPRTPETQLTHVLPPPKHVHRPRSPPPRSRIPGVSHNAATSPGRPR